MIFFGGYGGDTPMANSIQFVCKHRPRKLGFLEGWVDFLLACAVIQAAICPA